MNTIKIKRGTEATLPILEAAELGFTTDTHKVYIGDGTNNHPLSYLLKHNLSATVAPTINNDSSDGYAVGSKWVNITHEVIYQCTDATEGSAVWKNITQAMTSVNGSEIIAY